LAIDPDAWYSISPQQLPWALLFGVAAGVCIYISLKTDDGMLRGFGLTFLAINLYTRFFEFFWDGMHKVVFFLILAVSLAVIGRYAERIWHAGERRAGRLNLGDGRRLRQARFRQRGVEIFHAVVADRHHHQAGVALAFRSNSASRIAKSNPSIGTASRPIAATPSRKLPTLR
jgi:membrane protein implicated in regulation of membrane protease activity